MKEDIRFLITRKDNQIVVDVSVFPRGKYDPIIVFRTNNVKNYLEGKDIKFGNVLKTGFINNEKEESLLSQWIFEDLNPPKRKQKIKIK